MNRNPTKNNFRPASLRGTGTARTVLLRMAADQERADRIKALKQSRPDLTWKAIADHVGVTERAASDWQKKGGMEYANAKKLATLFEVETDYIWRGPTSSTPTPFVEPAELDLQAEVRELHRKLDAITEALERAFVGRTDQGGDIITRLDLLLKTLANQAPDELQSAYREILQPEAPLAPPGAPARPVPDAT